MNAEGHYILNFYGVFCFLSAALTIFVADCPRVTVDSVSYLKTVADVVPVVRKEISALTDYSSSFGLKLCAVVIQNSREIR